MEELGRGILKVDSFINHQIDTHLMFEGGRENLTDLDVPIVSLAVVADMNDGKVELE